MIKPSENRIRLFAKIKESIQKEKCILSGKPEFAGVETLRFIGVELRIMPSSPGGTMVLVVHVFHKEQGQNPTTTKLPCVVSLKNHTDSDLEDFNKEEIETLWDIMEL